VLTRIITMPWRVQSYKRVPVTSGAGFTTRPDGHQIADLEIWVDIPALAQVMGARAMRSKKGISILQGGTVTVKAINRRKVEE
jgi:hypothetical protein